jgi:hypothetical protein
MLSCLQEFLVHPKRPDPATCEELAEPWEEGTLQRGASLRGADSLRVPFKTIMPAPSLFQQDQGFWKSVHLVGEGLAQEAAAAKEREKEDWLRMVCR